MSQVAKDLADLPEQRGRAFYHGFSASVWPAGGRGRAIVNYDHVEVPSMTVRKQVLQLACQDDQCGFFDMGEADGMCPREPFSLAAGSMLV